MTITAGGGTAATSEQASEVELDRLDAWWHDLDRFHLVADVIDRVPGLGVRYAALRQHMLDERLRCRDHTRRTGEDAPDIRNWEWALR
jgi:phosphoketolase